VRSLLRRLRSRIRYRRFEADVAEEIEFHRAMKQREWEHAGLTAEQARLRTCREMGNVTREGSHAVWIASWLDSLWQDTRYAFRRQTRDPGRSGNGSACGLNRHRRVHM
jgi:hypothetical protein